MGYYRFHFSICDSTETFLMSHIGLNITVHVGCEFAVTASDWIHFGVDIDVLSAVLDAGTAVGLILIYFWSVNFFFSFGDDYVLLKLSNTYNIHWTVGSDEIRYSNGGGIRYLRRQWIGKAYRFDRLSLGQPLGAIFPSPPPSFFFRFWTFFFWFVK